MPLGDCGRWVDAADAQPRHWVEGPIWDAAPPTERLQAPIEAVRREGVEPALPVEPDADNPVLVDDREDGSEAIAWGVRLFEYLAAQANSGDPVGIGYAQFVCFVHRVPRFQDVANRQYARADTPHVISLAHQVTMAASGRRPVSRGGVLIQAGMDTFIWRLQNPHPRPQSAFQTTPYTEQDLRTVFPDGSRRLITPAELAILARPDSGFGIGPDVESASPTFLAGRSDNSSGRRERPNVVSLCIATAPSPRASSCPTAGKSFASSPPRPTAGRSEQPGSERAFDYRLRRQWRWLGTESPRSRDPHPGRFTERASVPTAEAVLDHDVRC
jgi:hypothetical protein